MNVPYPHFGVNFKVYPGTLGAQGVDIARTVEQVQERTGASFVVTPQLPDVRLVARETDVAVTAPRVDAVEPGRGMGRTIPETLADAGAAGAVVNHAEARDTVTGVERKIERCRAAGIDSLVCVDTVAAARAAAAFDPDALIFEKPDDISTDRAITQTHPDRVRAFVAAVEETNPRTKAVVGGGISTPEDVRLAFEQGADATGAASAVSLADDRESLLEAIAAAVPG
jgi:triosephosphate isomerase